MNNTNGDNNQKAIAIINEMRNKGTLPALSENVQDICSTTNLSSACAADLAAIIMRDCGLSSNLLSTANSVLYSPRSPIKTVSAAVTFLGFEKVRSMALGLSMFTQSMKSVKDRQLAALYASSYFSGTFAMNLAREANYSNPEEIFVAGLLYRLPSLALANTFPGKFQEVEKLVHEENKSFDQACNKVFGVNYDDICRGLTTVYNLPDNVAGVLNNDSKSPHKLTAIVHYAEKVADMLFSDGQGGQEAIEKANKKIGKALGNKDFSVSDFIKKACREDNNVSRFFELENDDVDMMVKALEWGKGNPAKMTAKFDYVEGSGDASQMTMEEDPEQLIGHFLTELMMASRTSEDINHIIMLAQEALFRCIPHSEVFTAFANRTKGELTGRFYAGNLHIVKAQDFKLKLDQEKSPVVKSINDNLPGEWHSRQEPLNLPYIKRHMNIKHAIFSPISASNLVIGMYFVARATDTPFNEREKIWLDQIANNVGQAFAKRKN